MAKQRADQMLVDRGLAESRARAQALIMAGLVFAGDRKIDKPGQQLAEDAALDVRGRDHPWVSRGGIKLAHGLDHVGWDVTGAVAIDVGSSTGGFTDVLLTRGAARVYAVDSGTNQLAWKLRQDPRVIVHEQTSARILTAQHIPEPIDLIVCDASFIGLAKVLERPLSFAAPGARLLALVKPQFEAGREEVGKGGVVRDPAVHARVCDAVAAWLTQAGWHVAALTQSPITGPEGNVEFLIAATLGGGGPMLREARSGDAVAMSDVLKEIVALTGRDRPSDTGFVLSHYIENPARIRCTVALDADGAIIGFQSLSRAVAGNRYDVPEGWGIIGTHISPRAHRSGIGRRLFAASLRAARTAGIAKIDAYISADSPVALGYYEAMGFRTYRETPGIVQKMFVLDPACA